MRLLLVVACALSSALMMQTARASGRRPSLHWTRGVEASSCIDPRSLAERVHALTGPVFVSAAEADYAIEGHIDGTGARGFALRLAITGDDRAQRGARVVQHHDADCRTFDDAIVFMIALTIDPDLDLEALVRDPQLEGRTPEEVLLSDLEQHPPTPAAVPPAAPPPPAPVLAAIEPPTPWEAHIAPLISAGELPELPELAIGVQLGFVVPVQRWLELGAQLRIAATVHALRIDDERQLRAQTFALAPLLCAHPPHARRITVRGCLGPEPSLLRARGLGFAAAQPVLLSVWGALAKLELGYQVQARWSLSLQGFVRINFEQKRLFYTDVFGEAPITTLQRWGGGVALGVTYRFGSGNVASAATHQQNEVMP